MQRFEIEMPMDFDLVDHGDTHIGDVLTHKKGLDRIFKYILEEPYRFWCHKGDWIEAITTDDKRFNAETSESKMTPTKQRDEAIKMYKNVTERGLFGLFGNHEAKLHRFGNMAEEICTGLGIRYGTYSCRVIFKHGRRKLFNGFFTHGRWQFTSNAKDYEQRQANMKAMLKMKLKYKMGDCALMSCGHSHKLMFAAPTNQLYLHDTPQGLQQKYLAGKQTGFFIDPDHRWYGCSGSFLKLYQDGITGYAELCGYDPLELGCLIWKIRDGMIVDCERMVV